MTHINGTFGYCCDCHVRTCELCPADHLRLVEKSRDRGVFARMCIRNDACVRCQRLVIKNADIVGYCDC